MGEDEEAGEIDPEVLESRAQDIGLVAMGDEQDGGADVLMEGGLCGVGGMGGGQKAGGFEGGSGGEVRGEVAGELREAGAGGGGDEGEAMTGDASRGFTYPWRTQGIMPPLQGCVR